MLFTWLAENPDGPVGHKHQKTTHKQTEGKKKPSMQKLICFHVKKTKTLHQKEKVHFTASRSRTTFGGSLSGHAACGGHSWSYKITGTTEMPKSSERTLHRKECVTT